MKPKLDVRARDISRKILGLYDGDQNRWTRGALARIEDRRRTYVDDESATCWCLVGAAHRVYKDDYVAMDHWRCGMEKIMGSSVYSWNDTPGRNFDDVMSVLQDHILSKRSKDT